MPRIILLVMDSVGVGALPDAASYGDEHSDTLTHIYQKRGNLNIPNLKSMGLGNIQGVGIGGVDRPAGAFGRCAEASAGKDTTTGHWEIAGIKLERPFPTYPGGFPESIIKEFEQKTGLETLGNYPASGTEIIQRLGDEHMRTGKPIVYTSADSVFQIACHEAVYSPKELYKMCETAREIMRGEHAVSRIIARPFEGESGNYARTKRRRDFSVSPTAPTMLDKISANGMRVAGVGKIEDIFNFKGLTHSSHTADNAAGMQATLDFAREAFSGLIFTNLVDFDTLYGHRNDVEGYARALERLDAWLPDMFKAMQPDDILIICADHGCDPTHAGTDHTREYIPLLCCGQSVKAGVNLGTRQTFADIAATALDYLGVTGLNTGQSFLQDILKQEAGE